MKYMFKDCISLTSLPDISKWNIENVDEMDDIFEGCISSICQPIIAKFKQKLK